MAKRGHNIDCITCLWGSGGVGLSVLTAALEAMLGDKNHKFFDPNIFLVDDELRKVIEGLVGAFCILGKNSQRGNVVT